MSGDDERVVRFIEAFDGETAVIAKTLGVMVRRILGRRVRRPINWRVPSYHMDRPLGHVSPAKVHVTLAFLLGVRIRDGSGPLKGTGRSHVRKGTLKAGSPLPTAAIENSVSQAKWLDVQDSLPWG